MNAVVFETFQGALTLQQVPDPAPPPDGVVIGVKANGICRSDWHAWMGHDPEIRLPHVPGHELAGVIEATGPAVHRWRAGDRVTLPFVVGCGRCLQCLAGQEHICDDQFQPGFTAWGSFAERLAIPRADLNLVRLPEGMDFVEAASLGCRFATAFRAVVTQGRLVSGEWLVVHGCGGVGLSALMIGIALGAQVLGVDVNDEALACAESLGADQVLHGRRTPDLLQAIRDLTRGGAHVSLDALGSPETCRHSIQCLRKRGRHVQVGLMLSDHRWTAVPMDLVIAKELEIYGSHGLQAHAYAPMLAMILDGRLQPRRLVRQRVTLREAMGVLAGMGEFRGSGVTVIDRF